MLRSLIVSLALLSLTSCTLGDSDQAGSTGPSISVHCDAAQPSGDTTAKIRVPLECARRSWLAVVLWRRAA
jgi:hypothetical protein